RHYRYPSLDRIRIVDDVDAGDGGRPRGRLDPGGQDSQCRGFPGTVGSQKSEDFAVLDGEVDALECVWPPATVLLAQFRYLDHGFCGRRRSCGGDFFGVDVVGVGHTTLRFSTRHLVYPASKTVRHAYEFDIGGLVRRAGA